MSNLQTCWRQRVCQNRLRTASPQGIAALAAQGGVATLTERSDETFAVGIEVRPLVPKGIFP